MGRIYTSLLILLLFSCKKEETPLPIPYLEPQKPRIITVYHQELNCSSPYVIRLQSELSNALGNESYRWLVDGQVYSSKEPLVQVDTGYKEIILKVMNVVGVDSFVYVINYRNTSLPVIPSFSYQAYNNNYRVPATIQFYNQSQRASSYLWDFGDGYLSNLESPEHVYRNAGTYTVKLKAMCEADTAEKTMLVTIKNKPSAIVFEGFEIVRYPKNYFPENSNDGTYGGDFYTLLYVNNFHEGTGDLFTNRSKLPMYWDIPRDWSGDYRFWNNSNNDYRIELWDKNDNGGDAGLISASFDADDIIDYGYPRYFDFTLDELIFRVYLDYED